MKDLYTDAAVDRLMSALLNSANISNLVSCGAEVLNNPIQVYDANYFCHAHSDMSVVDDPIWRMGKVGTNCLYEFASMLNQLNRRQPKLLGAKGQICYDIDHFGDHRRRIIPLVFSNELIGFLITLELNCNFDTVPDENYCLVASVIAKELSAEQNLFNYATGDTQKKVLLDLMNGNFSNKEIFSLRLRSLNVSDSTTFRIVSSDISEFRMRTYKYNYLETTLKSIFPRAWSVLMHSRILVLVDCSGADQLPEGCVEKLSSVMVAAGLKSGISDCFTDLFDSPQHYQQAMIALELSSKLHHNDPVVFFDRYKLWLCADSIDRQMRQMYVSSMVQKMHAYDIENGSQYVETLYHYLDSGKSLAKAGEALHLHRNTIVYRLERMKTLFGFCPGSSYEDMQNYLGCMILELEEKGY